MVSENSNGQTSAFFDIFGFNWDAPPTEDVRNKGGDPAIKKTASFIDYAADSYGSVVLNTAVWSLFILTSTCYSTVVRVLYNLFCQ